MAFRKISDITPAVTNAMMATDAMQAMRFRQVIETIEAHIEARPDIDPGMLEAFADRLRRRAWAVERERAV